MNCVKRTTRLFSALKPILPFASLPLASLTIPSVSTRFQQNPRFYFSASKAGKGHAHLTTPKSHHNGEGYYMEQLLTGCLSLYSYYVESNGQAAIIDPVSDIDKYLQILHERKAQLKYIYLTHFHADYVAGHLQLQKKYPQCEIVMGPKAHVEAYKVHVSGDNEVFKLGDISIKTIHTPGHTEESSCFLLSDKRGRDQILFTGDTLFLNEVGRPDLAVKSDLTSRDLANMLFDSLGKLKKLDNDVKVFPGHGAGSACGKNIGKGDFCTLGNQKQSNYALKALDKESFANEILAGMPTPPQYFFNVVAKNKKEPFSFDEHFKKCNKPLTVQEFKDEIHKGAKIIDVRSTSDAMFRGVIKGSYYIGHFGPFANFVGVLLDPQDNYVILGEADVVEDCIKRLLRIGYLHIKGFSSFSISDWPHKELVKYKQATVHDLHNTQKHENKLVFLDVRTRPEYSRGVFEGEIVQVPLAELEHYITEGKLDRSKEYAVHCASGYRSKIAATLLDKYQYHFKVMSEPFDFYVQNGVKIVNQQKKA